MDLKSDLQPECQKNRPFSLRAGPVKQNVPPKVQKGFVGEPGGGVLEGTFSVFFVLGTPAPFWGRFASQVAPGPSKEVILKQIWCHFS